jgi:hypothetical protein
LSRWNILGRSKNRLVKQSIDTDGPSLDECNCRRSLKVHQVEMQRLQNPLLLGRDKSLTDCRTAVGMAHVQRPESESSRSDLQFTLEGWSQRRIARELGINRAARGPVLPEADGRRSGCESPARKTPLSAPLVRLEGPGPQRPTRQ